MTPIQRNYFSIKFQSMPTDVLGCWHLLSDYLTKHNAMPKRLNLAMPDSEQDLVTDGASIATTIAERKLKWFRVNTGYTENSVYYTLHHNSFGHTSAGKISAPSEWGPLIESVVTRFETIGGWQFNWAYATWQTLREPTDFGEKWGPLPPGYTTWFEPPLLSFMKGRTLFDTSKNPGRVRIINHLAVFYPTAEMWLGPHFWQYAKCTKEEALAADFFIEKRDTPNFLYLKCWPTPFTRPDGEQGRMQQRLWKLFFHEDCEWPPGSGTICDEPMYGPPELMPGYQPPTSA